MSQSPDVPNDPPPGYAQQIVVEYFAPAYEALDQRNRELWASRKTDEERRAEYQVWMQKRRDDVNARNTVLDARLAELPDILQPIIALHHRDEDGDCQGCDTGYGSDGYPIWPCRTIELLLGDNQ